MRRHPLLTDARGMEHGARNLYAGPNLSQESRSARIRPSAPESGVPDSTPTGIDAANMHHFQITNDAPGGVCHRMTSPDKRATSLCVLYRVRLTAAFGWFAFFETTLELAKA